MRYLNTSNRVAMAAVAALALVVVLALVGCSSGTTGTTGAAKPTTAMPSASQAMSTAKSSPKASDGAQACANCAGKGMAPMVEGNAVDQSGVQVLKIGIKNGYYSPNQFVVKPGVPVKVVFTGKAKGCLAKPQFKALDKKGDLASGTATIDLGPLQPGTWEFSCGMGMTGGKIMAQAAQ